MNRTRGLLVLCLAAALPLSAAAETYTVAVEPSYPPDQAAEVYKPLLEYLGKQTGHTFEIVAVRNYHFYWRDLRQQKEVDFVFEEAHFVDYRVQRSQFEPLARKAENATYVLMADPEIAERGLNGLVGQNIVSMPAPSMGFALLVQMYKNPVSQPEIRSEASTWKDGVEMVFSGDAKAAMVPEFIAQQYPNLVEVARSRALPGAAFAAAPGVPAEVKSAVREALLKLAEDPAAFDILAELGASGFVEAKAADYAGGEDLLNGFFGYQPR
jgi:ABC-type phosphate/phosphonate transport system substrate-binding protein